MSTPLPDRTTAQTKCHCSTTREAFVVTFAHVWLLTATSKCNLSRYARYDQSHIVRRWHTFSYRPSSNISNRSEGVLLVALDNMTLPPCGR